MSLSPPRIIFVGPDGARRWEFEAPIGVSVMEIAVNNNMDMEGACEGNMACATCHVIVRQADYANIPAPSEDEEDMLDLAFGLQATSRLGCQIIITDGMDGLEVRLPDDGGNF